VTNRRVVYVASPYRAATARERRANLARGVRWLAWHRASFPRVTFVAPWITAEQSLGGRDSPAIREQRMVDDLTALQRCDGVSLCGGTVSMGMHRKRAATTDRGGIAINLTRLGPEPPERTYDPAVWGEIAGLQ
jgi:hypothetical protein